MKPMLFSNLELHLTTTRSSTFSGFKLALMGVTTLPATEKTRSNLDEVAGTGKTLLTSLARRGTESRDASPITAGPLWTAHQATVGKTSFFTPWGTLNFFSSSYSSSFTISLLFCACRWLLKALVEPWQTLMTKAEPEKRNMGVTFGWLILAQKTLCNGAIQIVSQVSPNFGCLFLQNNAVLLDGGHGYWLQR